MDTLNIEKMLDKIQRVESEIRNEFYNFFKDEFTNSTLHNHSSQSSQINKITSSNDLNKIANTRGFNIILTNYSFEENLCKLAIDCKGNLQRPCILHQNSTKKPSL